jgi:curli production assembly/transport component CsgE
MTAFLTATLFTAILSSAAPKQDSAKIKPAPAELRKLVEQVMKQEKQKSDDVDFELDGLLVDDTKTKTGKDFYDLFFESWQAPQGAKNFSIIISEKPFRLISTLVAITINDNVVYQAILQPRQDIIEALSEEAISYAQDYLVNYEEITRELNGDDMSGTGIF